MRGASASARQRRLDIGEGRAVNQARRVHRQGRDGIEHRADVVETRLAVHLRKTTPSPAPHASAEISRAVRRVEQHHRTGRAPARPAPRSGGHRRSTSPGCNVSCTSKRSHRWPVARQLSAPGLHRAHRLGQARRDGDARASASRQRGVAAAVVAVQMGVDDARQRRASPSAWRTSASVCSAWLTWPLSISVAPSPLARMHQDVVGRQPAALEDAQPTRAG